MWHPPSVVTPPPSSPQPASAQASDAIQLEKLSISQSRLRMLAELVPAACSKMEEDALGAASGSNGVRSERPGKQRGYATETHLAPLAQHLILCKDCRSGLIGTPSGRCPRGCSSGWTRRGRSMTLRNKYFKDARDALGAPLQALTCLPNTLMCPAVTIRPCALQRRQSVRSVRRRQRRRRCPRRGCHRRQCMHLQTPLGHQRLQPSAVEEAYDGPQVEHSAFAKFAALSAPALPTCQCLPCRQCRFGRPTAGSP